MKKSEEGLAWIDVVIGLFSNDNLLFPCFRIYGSQLNGLFPTLLGLVVDGLIVGKPLETRPALKLDLQGWGFHIDAPAFLNIKNDWIGFGQDLSGQGIDDRECLGAKLPRWNELQVCKPPCISRVHPVGNQLGGIRRPENCRPLLHILGPLRNHRPQRRNWRCVIPRFLAIPGQAYDLSGGRVTEIQVVFLHIGDPFLVWRRFFILPS